MAIVNGRVRISADLGQQQIGQCLANKTFVCIYIVPGHNASVIAEAEHPRVQRFQTLSIVRAILLHEPSQQERNADAVGFNAGLAYRTQTSTNRFLSLPSPGHVIEAAPLITPEMRRHASI
jgi:hypothetical protein